jgi:MSHA pilin protein MshA
MRVDGRHIEKGFTAIELIVVIIIIAILASVALPRYVDLTNESRTITLNALAGAAASAMTINYAGCSSVGHAVTPGRCVKVDNCDLVGDLLQGGLPDGYTVTSKSLGAVNGASDTCTLTNVKGSTQSFVGVAAGI